MRICSVGICSHNLKFEIPERTYTTHKFLEKNDNFTKERNIK
ncbi:hypothetical protein ES706_05872 [subsurface metagenome]